ncbi:MAG: nucleoid-associated protein YgaU [Sulfitobacter sp.]|jgi:nucleoid-associated protein YgaU
MSVWTVLGLGATATVSTAAAAVVVVIGAVGYFVILPQFQEPDVPEPAVVVQQEQAPEVVPEAVVMVEDAPVVVDAEPEAVEIAPEVAAEAASVEEVAPAEEAGPRPPTFDVVRVDGLGSALVAGIAEPGKIVDVLLDGVSIVEASSGRDGRFVTFFDIPPSDQPRSLQLSVRLEDGMLLSAETILIAPFAMAVAEAEIDQTSETAEISEIVETVEAIDTIDTIDTIEIVEAIETVETIEIAETTETIETIGTAETIETAALSPDTDLSAPQNLVTRAPAAPALVVATQDGVRVLQPSAAPVISAPGAARIQVNVTIDTISYDADGVVEIAGRGQGGGFVRLYLDNLAVKTTPVTNQGVWGANLPGVEPGIYTLRVDELDVTGAVTSRFETPFKREEPAIVAAAQLALAPPEPIETAVPSVPSVTTSTSQPTVLSTEPTAPVVSDAEAVPATTPQTEAVEVAVVPTLDPAARPTVSVITVQPGFTLWQIAQEMMGQGEMYVQVYEANRAQIRDPNLIYPGQVFTMPANQ